jgi:hypothetical protein
MKTCANCKSDVRKGLSKVRLSVMYQGERMALELPRDAVFCCMLCVVEAFRKDFTSSVKRCGKTRK